MRSPTTSSKPDRPRSPISIRTCARSNSVSLEALPVKGRFDRTASLHLSLRHPIQAELDRDHTLRPGKLGWRTEAAPDLSHDWNVQLASENGDWRIQGRLPKGQHAVYLKPAQQNRRCIPSIASCTEADGSGSPQW
jgi:hypothetical protein